MTTRGAPATDREAVRIEIRDEAHWRALRAKHVEVAALFDASPFLTRWCRSEQALAAAAGWMQADAADAQIPAFPGANTGRTPA
jgi:hypothetical protein